MKPSAETYADLFTMNFQAVRALCRDVTEDEARRRPDGRQNPMLWMVGHIATYRAEALSILGGSSPRGASLKACFGKDVRSEAAAWPSLVEVLSDLAELHSAVVERIRALGDAAFDKLMDTPGGMKLPTIVFLHFHESYHVGQVGFVRTWLGKSALVRSAAPPAGR